MATNDEILIEQPFDMTYYDRLYRCLPRAQYDELARKAREADTLRAALGEAMVLLEALEAAEREADATGGLHLIAPALRGELQAAIVTGRKTLGIGAAEEADHA